MSTPSPDTDNDHGNDDVFRFRAASFDEALALANAELGEHLEIVEANRIRRGGLGGFFATDLGVEVVVRPALPARPLLSEPDEASASDSAIDRLLALVDAQERANRRIAAADEFGAALARELDAAEPAMSTEDWSVDAYRRLAIPATAPAPVAEVEAEAEVERERPRRTPPRELAARLSETARAAAAQSYEDGPGRAPLAADGAHDRTVDLVTKAASALFGQLGSMPVVAGSQAAQVRRLTVTVSDAGGKVIEFSAELGE